MGLIGMTQAFASAQTETPIETKMRRPGAVGGEQIERMLGGQFEKVAQRYGYTGNQLRQVAARDHALHADHQGHLFCVCEGLAVAESLLPPASGEEPDAPLPENVDVFALSSRPEATISIYLDFDGHLSSGTAWNIFKTGGLPFTTPPFDIDGDPSTFSEVERSRIYAVWASVAEDFAPWEVNVTTVDPGPAALLRFPDSDLSYGVRVCIGGSSTEWYGTLSGGAAYLNSFDWSSDTPCYVFTDQLGNGNPKFTAEAVSHEVGHTLSLGHDGTTTGTVYYEGHGDWAPIMGVGYFRPITQWSNGQYPLANNFEDDIALISHYMPLAPDTAGDDISTDATLASGTMAGVIETEDDADLFRLDVGNGRVELSAVGPSPTSNLDLGLGLYDAYGDLVAWSDPEGLDAALSVELIPGTYFVSVEGVSPGDTALAYDAYASLGHFVVSASFVPTSDLPPVAAASALTPTSGTAPFAVPFSSDGSSDPDGSIVAFDWDFGDGGSSTESHPVHTFEEPGSYTVSLVVRDDQGASASDTVVVEVAAPLPLARVTVLGMIVRGSPTIGFQAASVVAVVDEWGHPIEGALVTLRFGGPLSSTRHATTSGTGRAYARSYRFRRTGLVTLDVTAIAAPGYRFDPEDGGRLHTLGWAN